MKKLLVFLSMLGLIFMFSCGGDKKESSQTDDDQTEIPDGDTDDIDMSDIEVSDEDSDTGDTEEQADNNDTDTEETGKKQGGLYGSCYPNKTCDEGLVCDEENDICIKSDDGSDTTPGGDSDTDSGDTDSGDTDSDGDTDGGTPVNPEATENHKISGSVQAGSATTVALYECGGTEKIAEANTDSKGNFSFNADITAAKSYCVKANDFASCFKGLSDHTANISEITTSVYLLDKNCADLRKSETKIRTYTKLGTGAWLGVLDYSRLSGIREGLKLLSSFIGSNDAKTMSEKIAEDAAKENPEFAKFFNGFRVLSDKVEIIIGESADDSANFSVEGGSSKVAPGFRITWTIKNKSADAATYKFSTSVPGEYTARAKLDSDGGDPIMLSQGSATVLFMQRKNGGTVYLQDTSKNISFRIDDGIYGIIPKGTVVKKNGSVLTSISYDVLATGGNQVSRLKFRPEGAVFEGDTMYFVHELGTVFGGDPIMLSATRTNADGSVDVMNSAAGDPIMMAAAGDPIMTTAAGDPIMQAAAGDPIMTNAAGDPIMTAAAGDPIMTSAAGDPIMTNAAGDPIMTAAAGDPIMTSAAGDPIMASAAGDPIMMGTSSSTMISQTSHYSTFTVEAASLPVSVDALVAKWCDLGSFLHLNSPLEFIRKGVEKYKPAGEDKTRLLSYLDCDHFADLGSDLYELINKQVGFNRNLNLIENIFFAAEFHERMVTKQDNTGISAFVAVKNGLELRSAIAALYTATTSYNRSATLADIFDPSMMPMTYSGAPLADYASSAKAAIIGNAGAADRYIATKKEMMIFANYITTSSKGPDFRNVESMLTPDQLVCAWMNPDTEAADCNKVYALNEAGHVTLGGTEVSVAEANAVFTKLFMPMNSRLSEEEKLHLFRTFYLALKYAGTIFYGGNDMDEFKNSLLKTAYLVFDGIEGNANAVSIVDSFNASAHTVSVLDGAEMATVPYLTKLSALTDKIALKVAAASADVEKVLINIEGRDFNKVQENTRTYYKPDGDLKEKSIVLTPGTLAQGEKALKDLLGSENVDSLGNITGKMTIVVNSKISGKTYSTQKTYDFFVNDDSEGVNSKPVPANIQIFVNDSNGQAIAPNANPTVILNPGNKVYYPANGIVSLENLTPAVYTIDAVADGYYAKNVSVNVPAGAAFSVEIRLDEEDTTSADANLELSIKIDTIKHPSKVYIQIYNDDMDLVANEAAKFIDEENTYETLNIALNSGRYTLLAVGEDMYNYLEAITLYEGNNSKEITVVAKNACGNGIIDSAEECEPSQTEPVLCGTIYPASTYPEKSATCDPATCTFDKTQCGKAAFCGDGILDAGEGCDGGAKDCSEIAGFGNARGTAPCKNDDCSGYVTANNCSKTTADCGTLPENAVWNDGTGRFTQKYDGANWLPAAKTAEYGLTKDECTFSCIKGSLWDVSSGRCVLYPLSLALICTGQTGCFNTENETECPAYGETFFGQDAQYAAAKYCTPHTVTTEGSGENAVVKDAYTHYEWHAVASGSAMTWAEAETACFNYEQENGGSTAVWRLPSPTELLTVADNDPADITFSFWAAEDARDSNKAWRVDENGSLASVAKTERASVICIRYQSNYSPAGERFSSDNAETVKDTESGLMWQKQPVSSSTWKEALEYCYNVSTADKFDWRLPNRNELASLIDYEKANGAASDFPGIAEKGFWTSTSSVNEEEKAWTVDFASGKIEAAEKNGTKYVICVRNDEPCFGDECPNACGFAPCKDMANSTGLCTANDYSFTCGCKSGFNWNHANCLLDTTRYIACTGLPENASWNRVFGISQSYDGKYWYPSEVGSFNKTPSSTECRFICNTNYTWDAENDKCQPKSTVTQCSEKKPNSEWNSVPRISQTWDGEKWVPSATSVYNMTESETECRFKCKEHYNWNDENNLCDPETQPATCIGLPANAHWWNDPATITQTWTNGGWAPVATGSYHDTAENNKCYFGCNENYEWNNTSCVAKSQPVNCEGLPDNAEWTGEYSSIKQTWNGSEWYPSNVGTYNTESNSAYCRFKCKENYNWNGSTCVAATQIARCTGNPANSQWNTVSSITQTYMEIGENTYGWSPSAVGSYGNPTTTECHFTCKENYEWINNECVGRKQIVECTGLPANAQWQEGHSTVEQQWNGTQGWLPSAVGQHNVATGCSFECETEHYTWDSATSTCIGKTRNNQDCTGKPDSAVWNTVSKINQTWNGKAWLPDLNATYNENSAIDECRFKCPVNYTWNGSTCEPRTQIVSCGTLPPNAAWNTVSQIKQTWNGSTEKWEPAVNLEHNDTSSETECRYTCKTNYEWKNNQCTAKKQTAACQGLPANAVWNKATVEQTWNGTSWSPETNGTHTTGSATDRCYFKCIDEGTKFDWVDGACTGHTNPNVACDNNSLPSNASWWNSSINQTWNGTEWLPTTTGSFGNSAVDNQCRFYCNNHYNWNGTTCEAETRIRSCEDLPNTTAYEYNVASSITQHWDEGVSGFVPSLTPEYSSEATTVYCRFKCKENYEWKNGSCQAAKKTGNCTGLPANAQWNTKLENGSSSDGQITQTWNGENWEPELSGGFGGQDAPAANSCIFKCEENYEWKDNLCAAKKRTVQCIVLPDELPEGLPEDAECEDIESCCRKYPSLCQPANAAWNEVPTVLQEWKGAAWSPSDVGIHNDEPSQSECFFKCKENYSWDEENEVCVADTRIEDCTDLPDGAVWNYAPYITQTWSGSEWLPSTKAKYSVSASEDECLYICDTGKYSYDGLCVTNACTTPDDHDYFPCESVENSSDDYIGDCTSKDHLLLPYSCKCNSGYYWYGKTGCRNVKPKNICTDAVRCYNIDHEIGCPSEGEDFYGQDVQYADKGYCAQKDFTIEETGGVQITYDKNTGLRWQKAIEDYGTWEWAKSYCSSLNASSYGGYSSGWRLPTIKELQTIVDYGKSSPALDTNYFDPIYTKVWSATEDAADSEKAWYLDEMGGSSSTLSKYSKPYVRCVRGTTLSETLSTSTTNGVRKDDNTKLYWQVSYTSKTWEEALKYCENLEYGGYSDWRLPNVNELYSLINHGRYGPASTFSGMPGARFWTSTANAGSVLSINFTDGGVSTITKNYSEYVRCVRSDLCDAGEYWDGKNCTTSPCNENPCTMENSNGACTPLPYYSAWTYSCGCVEGYRWDARVRECVADPCFDNICESMEGSTGQCIAYDGSSSNTMFKCLCVDGYFWDGSRCRPSGVPGNVCTNNGGACYNNTTTITCPTSESADFYGQDRFGSGKCESNMTNVFTQTDVADQPVVRVPRTGQMWQKNVPTTKYTFNRAVTYCADLDYGGYTDWRLPKPKELFTIVGIGTSSFPQPGAGSGFTYWTSKKDASDPNKAWWVTFEKRDVYNYLGRMYAASSGEENYVRCVRGEILPENSSFTEFTPEGTTNVVVKDNVTGLIWQKTESGSLTWQAALKYCADSTYAGYTDWRLPSKDELVSILNFDRHTPATDFPGTFSSSHWTSTTDDIASSSGTYKYAHISSIHFSGDISSTSKTSSNRVRCVR